MDSEVVCVHRSSAGSGCVGCSRLHRCGTYSRCFFLSRATSYIISLNLRYGTDSLLRINYEYRITNREITERTKIIQLSNRIRRMRMKWTDRHMLRMSDNKTKQQAITRKAEEALGGLCGRRFTWSRNLKIRHHNWQTTCITPGDIRRQKSME